MKTLQHKRLWDSGGGGCELPINTWDVRAAPLLSSVITDIGVSLFPCYFSITKHSQQWPQLRGSIGQSSCTPHLCWVEETFYLRQPVVIGIKSRLDPSMLAKRNAAHLTLPVHLSGYTGTAFSAFFKPLWQAHP